MVDFNKLREKMRDPEYQKKAREEAAELQAVIERKEALINSSIKALLAGGSYEKLSDWEKDFVISCRKTMNRQFVLSDKQESRLAVIAEREFPGSFNSNTSAKNAEILTENSMVPEQKKNVVEANVADVARQQSVVAKLSEMGHDTGKYHEQLRGKMIVERAQSLDDDELHRVFSGAVLEGFCIRYMQAARDAGLTIADVYHDIPEGSLEHADFVEVLHRETGLGNQDAVALADKLQALAAKHFKMCHIDLAEGLSDKQEGARDVMERDMRALLSGVTGVKDAAFIYEPRGTTVGIKFESGASNSFSNGGMYKVPVMSSAVEALNGVEFWSEYEDRAGVAGGYYLVSITETGNAAFVEAGRANEVGRILEELSEKIEQDGISREKRKLYDLNGNPVGTAEFSHGELVSDVPAGQVRLQVATDSDALVKDPEGELARILRVAADQSRDGRNSFGLMDINGNSVGKFDMPDLPSLEKGGVVDMQAALGERRVYWADDSMMGLAEGEFRFVVTTAEFEPGYGQGSGDVWLVNAKGEVASGYEDAKTVREDDFRELKKDEKQLLQQVIDGSLSLEQFESRFDDEAPENN